MTVQGPPLPIVSATEAEDMRAAGQRAIVNKPCEVSELIENVQNIHLENYTNGCRVVVTLGISFVSTAAALGWLAQNLIPTSRGLNDEE